MSRQHRHRPLRWISDVKGADHTIDARSGNDGGAVFVPVVSEGFGGRDRLLVVCWDLRWRVEGDGSGEVV